MIAYRGRIYQSGERVSISGAYEVVGLAGRSSKSIKTDPVQQLHIGEIFPCFEGLEVCWHLCARLIEPTAPQGSAADVSDTTFFG